MFNCILYSTINTIIVQKVSNKGICKIQKVSNMKHLFVTLILVFTAKTNYKYFTGENNMVSHNSI